MVVITLVTALIILVNIILFYPFSTTPNVRYVYSFEISNVKPVSVAYDPKNDRIIVADGNNEILIYDKDGRLMKKFGQTGEESGEFNGIMGLTYDPKNDRIIVADGNNKRIQIFDKDGNFLFMFKVFTDDISIAPAAITYDANNDRIIVGGAFTSTLFIYDKSGNFLTSFDIPKCNRFESTFPSMRVLFTHHIVYDVKNDRIIVAAKDGCADNVYIFKEGKLISTLSPPPSVSYLGESRVTYDLNNYRIIVISLMQKRTSIWLYDKDGDFITSINYNNIGDISDITYDSNNERLIIAEYKYDDYGRVQILTLTR
ncbi:MAG: 6-bladed beta-propeller [Candidatus Nitrosocaldus sp.]